MKKLTLTLAFTVVAVSSAVSGGHLPYPVADGSDTRVIAGASRSKTAESAVRATEVSVSVPVMKAGYSGSTIYGYLAYDDEALLSPGLYEVTPSGDMRRQWSYSLAPQGPMLAGGWQKGDRLCSLAMMVMSGDQLLSYYAYQELSLSDGKITKSVDIHSDTNKYSIFLSCAYVPEEDTVYGYTMSGGKSDYAFSKAPADDIEAASPVTELGFAGDRCYSFCYNQQDDSFYGITTTGNFVRVDRSGAQSVIFNVGLDKLANIRGGLTYSPYDGYFIWNPQFYGLPSALYAIYPETGTLKLLRQFDYDKYFTFFFTPDSRLESGSPVKPGIKSVDFVSGSHTAEVTYMMPSALRDGTKVELPMTWSAMVNGAPYSSGTAASGEEVMVKYTGLLQGECTLQFEAEAGGKASAPAVVTVYAGNDIPRTPANVSLTSTEVTWDAVTEGVHDAYVDPLAIEYKVYVNDMLAGVTSDTRLPVTFDREKEVSSYKARVIAVCNGEESEPGVSDKLIYGKPFGLPYTIVPTKEQVDLVRIFNEDNGPAYGIWEYTEAWKVPCFTSGWSMDCASDDWLIFPDMYFPQSENVYRVSLKAARGGYASQEYFEVWAGKSPEPSAMTIPVFSKTKARSREWSEYESVFAVPEPGTYYIGVRCVSDPNQYALIVRDITVEATDMKATMPAAVTSLKVMRTSDADLTATVSFRLPETDLIGNPLPAGTRVKATATCASEVSVTGEPGSIQQLTVATAQGDNVITVQCETAGEKGKTAEVIVFTGVDLPYYVENFESQISEDNMSIRFTWEAPLEGLEGGYFSQKDITYWIGEMEADGEFAGEPVNVGTDVYEYTYVLPQGAPLKAMRLGIAAENAAGMSPARWFTVNVAGTPHSIPMFENFDNIRPAYEPLLVNRPTSEYSDGGWDFCQPELVAPEYVNTSPYAIIGYTDAQKARVRLSLPKFSTKTAENPVVTFELWTGKGAARTSVLAATYGMDAPETIADIPAGSGWQFVEVVLPEKFKGRDWVTVSIDGVLASSTTYLIISSYRVSDGRPSGIESCETAVRSITSGERTVTVSGYDGEKVAIYSLDGRLVCSATATETLTVEVAPGVYVVTVGPDTRKLIVR